MYSISPLSKSNERGRVINGYGEERSNQNESGLFLLEQVNHLPENEGVSLAKEDGNQRS